MNNKDIEEQFRKKRLERQRQELHWYALFVQGNHERNIATALIEREKENLSLPDRLQKPEVVNQVFVPTRQVKRKWSDRVKVVDVVLTTGMIFVRMKLVNQRDVYIDPYIRHFLYDRDSRTPAVIPDSQMSDFMSVLNQDVDVSVCAPEVGDKVRILRGPYEGRTGYLIRKDNTSRFQLKLCHGLAFQFNISMSDVALVSPDAEDIIPDVRYK